VRASSVPGRRRRDRVQPWPSEAEVFPLRPRRRRVPLRWSGIVERKDLQQTDLRALPDPRAAGPRLLPARSLRRGSQGRGRAAAAVAVTYINRWDIERSWTMRGAWIVLWLRCRALKVLALEAFVAAWPIRYLRLTVDPLR
jgi:hypothetical protein